MGHSTVPLLERVVLTVVGGVAGVLAIARGTFTRSGRPGGSASGVADETTGGCREEREPVGEAGER